MEKKIKATLFISEDKREKIRRSGLSLEEYFNRLYDMCERFTMDRWTNGCFWIDYYRVCFIRSETVNFLLDDFDDENLLRKGRKVGENIKRSFKYGYNLEPLDEESQRKIIDNLCVRTGWGTFTLENRAIIIENPIINKPFFLQGYLEGFLDLELKLIESHPDRIAFEILEEFSELGWMEKQLEFEEKFRDFAVKGFDLIFTIDREGRVTYFSPSMVRLCDHDHGDVIGKPFQTFLPESEVPKAVKAFKKCLDGYLVELPDLEMLMKSGSKTCIKMYMYPIILNRKVAGVQGIAKEIKF